MSLHGTERREPALNIPFLLVAATAVLIAIHLGRDWLSGQTDLRILLEGGFIPARWSLAFGVATPEEVIQAASAFEDPDEAATQGALARYVVADGETGILSGVTYALLHGSWMHVILNCLWLATFASPVVRRLGVLRAAILALVSTLAAALAYWAANPLSPQLMIGASGTVSGFMGAAALFVFPPPSERQAWRGSPAPRASIGSLLRNRSALMFLGTWFVLNLAAGLLAGPLGIADTPIAWQAHSGGLVAGLLAFPWLDPVSADEEP